MFRGSQTESHEKISTARSPFAFTERLVPDDSGLWEVSSSLIRVDRLGGDWEANLLAGGILVVKGENATREPEKS